MTALVKYEAALHAIADCKAVDEVKEWADKAAAMQAYGRMAKDKTLEVDAAEIRIRAERRLGEMLAAQKADGGLNAGTLLRGSSKEPRDERPRLADAGIDKKLSSRAQKLAAVPAAEFEAEVGEWRERVSAEGARVSAKLEAAGEREIARRAKNEPAQKVDPSDDDRPSTGELLEDLQRDVERLTAQVKALSAGDQGAELLKQIQIKEHLERARDDEMAKNAKLVEQRDFYMRQLRRCGRAVGQEDLDRIAAAVEAFVRAHKKVAA